jgi:hypothetical protein
MPFIVLVAILIGVAYVAINFGSKQKMSLAKIALSMLVVCVIAYLAYPPFASLVNGLMQAGMHVQFR